MTAPIPKTKAQDILEALLARTKSLNIVNPFESREFKREIETSIKADVKHGWMALTLLASLSNNPGEFKRTLENVRKIARGDEQIRILFFGHAAALGMHEYALTLLEEIGADVPEFLDKKLYIYYHAGRPDLMRITYALMERLKLQSSTVWDEGKIMAVESSMNMMKRLGIEEREFSIIQNVASNAVRAHGSLLFRMPHFYYDPEEKAIFMDYTLPVSIETACAIEETFYELAHTEEGFPIGRVLLSINNQETEDDALPYK